MFDFLNFKRKKKKITDTSSIKTFDNIIKVIEDFMYFEEFDKSTKAINEVIKKENDSFNKYLDTLKEEQKQEEITKFKKRLQKITKLEVKNNILKEKYEKKLYQKKKTEEIKYIEKKIIEEIGKTNFDNASNILNELLNHYPNDEDVISFINKQKKIINKKITQDKEKKEKQIKNDAYLQAQQLIGEIKNESLKLENQNKSLSLFEKFKHGFFFYSKFKKKLEDKRLLDEINLLLKIQGEDNEILAKTKLTQVHSGISREIVGEKINGYDLYGKILGADKITGDSLGINSGINGTTFFIGDATGHGIKAGFITSQLTKKFQEFVHKLSLENLVMEINNSLKQDLKSGNFITSIFFNINNSDINKVKFVGMGHEPMFIYRKQTNTVEKIIPGGLASGIRIIKDLTGIKSKELVLNDGDIIVCYTDGIAEARNEKGEMYSIDRVGEKLLNFMHSHDYSVKELYKKFTTDLKNFTGGKVNYLDDVTLLIFKRDKNKEIINNDKIIDDIIKKEGIEKKYKKNIRGKNFEEIKDEILKIQKENALKNIIKHLDVLYKTGEIPKLKQDCIRYIREGYIHKKINKYLKEALDKENLFKVKQKNQKVIDKYNVLKELYKKGDFETVVSECSNIISKDGNI